MYRYISCQIEENPVVGPAHQGVPLSRSMDLENFEERRMMDLVNQTWEPPPSTRTITPRR